MVKSGDAQAVAIYEEYNGSVMTSFPQLSNEDIDNILAYTDYTPPAPDPSTMAVATTVEAEGSLTNDLILAVLLLVLAALVSMLFWSIKHFGKLQLQTELKLHKKKK